MCGYWATRLLPAIAGKQTIVNLDDVVDSSFVEAAVKELGPYRR